MEGKEFETNEVEIYKDQFPIAIWQGLNYMCLNCIEETKNNLSLAIINQMKDPSTVLPTLFTRKCLGENKIGGSMYNTSM